MTLTQRKAALQELADKNAHGDYLFDRVMNKPVPKRTVPRAIIHQQKTLADLRDAFAAFGMILI